jgi:hypothetical protein
VTCYPDCRSGGADGYCDEKRDYICDADCGKPYKDPDCTTSTTIRKQATEPNKAPAESKAWIYAAIGLVAIGLVAAAAKKGRVNQG